MRTDTSADLPFPHPAGSGEADFVLDGMQRLASLYGALNGADEPSAADPFAFVFNLDSERFVPARDSSSRTILLRKLFQPRHLLEEQARLSKLEGGDALVERTLDLQRIFQEYLLPVIRIGNAYPEQVVQIFERVNNTGTNFSAVDFMRAQTWSGRFDLSDQISHLSDAIANSGFDVPHDTIAKSIALSLNVIPTGEQMIHLRERSDAELLDATERTAQSLKDTIAFFKTNLRIQSFDFIPYEGQFLVATSMAMTHGSDLPAWFTE